MRRSKYEEVSVEINDKAALEDVGQNADLNVANQDANTQTQAHSQRSDANNVKPLSDEALVTQLAIAIVIICVYMIHI